MKIEILEHFVGKVCTVFTVPTNRDFKSENPSTFPQPIFHYFVGKVLEVDSRGILLEQWNNSKKLRTFFFIDHIISISEEEILDPSKEEDLKLIQEFKKVNTQSQQKANENVETLKKQKEELKKTNGQFLDINSLSSLSKEMQKFN